MSVFYIDPTASGGGTGTVLNPFNSFAQLEADLTGDTILGKSGTTILEAFTRTSPNMTLGTYGGSSHFKIDGGVPYTGTWIEESAGVYYTPSSVSLGLLADGVYLFPVSTKAAMTAPGTFWDSPSQRQYVTLPNGVNPASVSMRAASLVNCLSVNVTNAQADFLKVEDWHFHQSKNGAFNFNCNMRVFLENCIAEFASDGQANPSGAARNGFNLYGKSASRSLRSVISNCISRDLAWNSFELQYMDNVLFERPQIARAPTGIEIWGHCNGVKIYGGQILDLVKPSGSGSQGAGIWVTHSNVSAGATGDIQNVHIEGNVINNAQNSLIKIQSGSGHRVINNFLIDAGYAGDSTVVLFLSNGGVDGTDDVTCNYSQNVLVHDGTSTNNSMFLMKKSALIDTITGNNNAYWSRNHVNTFRGGAYAGGNYFSGVFATYQAAAAANGLDVNSVSVDPKIGTDNKFQSDSSFYQDTIAPWWTLSGPRPISASGVAYPDVSPDLGPFQRQVI
jgi:hypothetical protein